MQNVIVFDIDGILCWQRDVDLFDFDELQINHPDCHLIVFPMIEAGYIHCFVPYLDVLMNYLINTGSRIAFFSAGSESRNIVVIGELLIKLFGEVRYQELKDAGQFNIFSGHQMRIANSQLGEEYTTHVKDLNIVLEGNETILDAILIDDQPRYVAHDQTPCIVGIVLEDLLENFRQDNFSKNAVYYLLGVFSNYFNDNQDSLPIRVWMKNFFLEHTDYNIIYSNLYLPHDFFIPEKNNKCVLQLIQQGLQEVQKTYPDAMLYGQQEKISVANTRFPPSKLKITI